MQSLHKFVCVLFILHIISRSLCIGCSISILIPCERWNENTNIVYYLLSIVSWPIDARGLLHYIRIGPMWGDPKLHHLYWPLSRSADSTANKSVVI